MKKKFISILPNLIGHLMNYLVIIGIAFALAIDAFAVSVAAGIQFGKATQRQYFRLSFHFGLFQFLMPIIGWLCGSGIAGFISDYDHWLAFGILASIGIKMIYDGFRGGDNVADKDVSRGSSLVMLSLATSIDALAVGFSLGLLGESILLPSIIIGIVASAMSIIGIAIGERISGKFGSKFSIIGGLVLIGIGLKIVFEHLSII